MAETATATSGSHGAAAEHHPANYIAVFIYLTLLTGAELGIYGLGLPRTIMIGSLVALALAKAVLVAMYFMHLAMERKGLWVVAATPLVIVAFLLFYVASRSQRAQLCLASGESGDRSSRGSRGGPVRLRSAAGISGCGGESCSCTG